MDIVSTVKQSKLIYKIYYYSVSFLLKIARQIVKTDDKLILFVSFGGRYFNDNPKCIYDAMLKDKRFRGYRLVWAFLKPDKVDITTPKICINSKKYLMTALKARCWVTNTSIERGLNFKGKNTLYLQTTHTLLPKRMGHDDKSGTFTLPCGFKYDFSCAQSNKEREFHKSAYGMKDEQILVCGYPKNDLLCNVSEKKRNEIRAKLGIPEGKIAILYAPTYRDVNFGAMKSPVNFNKWEEVLGNRFIMLFRSHPVVANATHIDPNSKFVFDVSSYPDNVELMIASDILISDYSGIFFEYAVQKKPMFCYAYDYEEYVSIRPLYFDIRQELPGGLMNEQELLLLIKSGGFDEFKEIWDRFRDNYVSEYGKATETCLDVIYEHIKQ